MSDVEFVDEYGSSLSAEAEDILYDIPEQGPKRHRQLLIAVGAALLIGAGMAGNAVKDHQADQRLTVEKQHGHDQASRLKRQFQLQLNSGRYNAQITGEADGALRGAAQVYAAQFAAALKIPTLDLSSATLERKPAIVPVSYYRGVVQQKAQDGSWHDKITDPINLTGTAGAYDFPNEPRTGQYLGYISGGIETGLSVNLLRLGDDYRFMPASSAANLATSGQVQAKIREVNQGFYYYGVRYEGAGPDAIVGELAH